MEDLKLEITQALKGRALIGAEGHYSIADVWGEHISGVDHNAAARRIVAAWNACEGLETELLETLPLNFKAHAMQCAAMREENATLRAAVLEMERMLPVLEFLSGHEKGWSMALHNNGVLSLNTYRQTLLAALAKIENK